MDENYRAHAEVRFTDNTGVGDSMNENFFKLNFFYVDFLKLFSKIKIN